MKPRLIIFGDKRRNFVAEAITEFVKFAKPRTQILANCFRGDCVDNVLEQTDFAVVFGGDGTILSAARDLSHTEIPIIGVNVGKLGFLAEFSLDELKNLFKKVTNSPELIEQRMMLSCTINGTEGKKLQSTAINDVVINAGAPHNMIDLKMSVRDQPLADCVSDGLIVSTPTGSTAYNLSAGGPIVSANIAAVVVTPICPHTFSFRPIVINADSKIEIYPKRVNSGTTAMVDGQVVSSLGLDDVVTIEKHKNCLHVVNNPLRTQWDTLAEKLNWATKPKYRNK